ncbi:hypothetical protein [Pantoea sp. Mhis]|uniref:hypothetical protein n=1 Tax=Pantoea sp. Mhis TaxID=2576759 RepID=UPI00351BA9E2
MKDSFENIRAVAAPIGALALASMKKYTPHHKIMEERLAHILFGVNLNFHDLRYVSEYCRAVKKLQSWIAVIIPDNPRSFLQFCQIIHRRIITEFNSRYFNSKKAYILLGMHLTHDHQRNVIPS